MEYMDKMVQQKIAIIEALHILQHIMSGNTISYNEYEGMLDDNEIMELSTVFILNVVKKYKAQYELLLKSRQREKKYKFIQKVLFIGKKRCFLENRTKCSFLNPYYDTQSILENMPAYVISNNKSKLVK